MLAKVALQATCLAAAAGALPTSFPMSNAANPGMSMPAIGLGTAGGSTNKGYGNYPECWASCLDRQCLQPMAGDGCGMFTEAAIATWFQLGGRRVDDADTYRNQDSVGNAIRNAAIPRSEIFFQTKVGPDLPMGYNQTWNQTMVMLNVTGLDYVDHLMLHWPSCETGNGCGPSEEPACNYNTSTYNDTECRLSSWRALLDIWKAGYARSVGVSNFNISHLEDIKNAGLTLPSANQISFHLYHSVAEKELLEYCNQNGIVFNSWTPFARPDSWVMQAPCATTPITDATAAAIGAKYNRTGAQIQLAFQVSLGVAPQPRTQNVVHMWDNLNIFDIELSDADLQALWGVPQNQCAPPACTNPVYNGCPSNAK